MSVASAQAPIRRPASRLSAFIVVAPLDEHEARRFVLCANATGPQRRRVNSYGQGRVLRFFVASARVRDLLVRAKHLFVAALWLATADGLPPRRRPGPRQARHGRQEIQRDRADGTGEPRGIVRAEPVLPAVYHSAWTVAGRWRGIRGAAAGRSAGTLRPAARG